MFAQHLVCHIHHQLCAQQTRPEELATLFKFLHVYDCFEKNYVQMLSMRLLSFSFKTELERKTF